MKGLELAREYYGTFGKEMLEKEFPELLPKIAAGLFGSGSECFGFDDEVSRDHDLEPGFLILLPGEKEVGRREAFLLERAYAKLPKEFGGFSRGMLSPVGGARRGVVRTEDFFREKTGFPEGPETAEEWLRVPEYALAEAVNGEVFFDGAGRVSRLREKLARYPEDVRKKKLAANLLLMGQAGQYNYSRALAHGETGAAQLAIFEFADRTMQTVFLLNRVYRPYYKWSFRAMRGLPRFPELADTLEFLITTDNGRDLAGSKAEIVEDIAGMIIEALREEELTGAVCMDLEKHAYSVNDRVEDPSLRNAGVLYAL